MANNVPTFAVTSAILASAVTNTSTFTLPYPTGYVQANFTAGLAGATHVIIVNGNDRYVTGTLFTVSFDASVITVTNSTGATLAAGATVVGQFNVAAGNNVEIITFPVDLATVTGAMDVVTSYRPGFAGAIEAIDFLVDKPVTTASKLATFTAKVNSTATTSQVRPSPQPTRSPLPTPSPWLRRLSRPSLKAPARSYCASAATAATNTKA
jgi:hypothetical protein